MSGYRLNLVYGVFLTQDSWHYHLSVIQSGEKDLKLTNTEKLISEMEKSVNHHHLWTHPVLNVTVSPLQRALTSLPSTSLNEDAKKLFHRVQAFTCTHLAHPYDTSKHISLAQSIIGQCLKKSPLKDEVYCQILKQISGHQSPLSTQVTHVSGRGRQDERGRRRLYIHMCGRVIEVYQHCQCSCSTAPLLCCLSNKLKKKKKKKKKKIFEEIAGYSLNFFFFLKKLL